MDKKPQLSFINQTRLKMSVKEITRIQAKPIMDHSQLDNLDYEHSGHTGFASKNDLLSFVPKRLENVASVSPEVKNNNLYLFVDAENGDAKMNVKELGERIIKRVDRAQTDYNDGQFIFEKIEGDK